MSLATANKAMASQAHDSENVMRLIKQVLTGNRDAFDEIVFLYRDQVYATCWHLTHNVEDALDVTQEVFFRVFKCLSTYKGNARFSTWLHRIVLNACVDYLRRERKHRDNKVEDEEDEEDHRSSRSEGVVREKQRDVVVESELNKRVSVALAELSDRQRNVFLLRYYNDLSLKEVAEVLRCTEGSVKRHLFRAQARLRELLKDIERT